MPFEHESVNLSPQRWPVDKLDQNCVESEDLFSALRYDPPFRFRSFGLISDGITADSGSYVPYLHASTMMNLSLQRLFSYRIFSSGVRRVTYALATVSCPFAG